ncbi:hypothetical protein ACF0H2_07720 [Serratia marcescens]
MAGDRKIPGSPCAPPAAGHTFVLFRLLLGTLFCMMMGSELVIFDEELRRDPWALLEQTQRR